MLTTTEIIFTILCIFLLPFYIVGFVAASCFVMFKTGWEFAANIMKSLNKKFNN
ncbi:MAG: hypothetical protein ACRC5T_11010 [Cetobacterium sp.]